MRILVVSITFLIVGCGSSSVPTTPQGDATSSATNIVDARVVTVKYIRKKFREETNTEKCVVTQKVDGAKLFELQRDNAQCDLQEAGGIMIYDCSNVSCGYACKANKIGWNECEYKCGSISSFGGVKCEWAPPYLVDAQLVTQPLPVDPCAGQANCTIRVDNDGSVTIQHY